MRYDAIVIGAGSAGCVMATRLAEDSGRSVLLLEAGPDYPDIEQLPDELRYDSLGGGGIGTLHNWSFVGTATPQQTVPMPISRGKVVGGSGAITGPIFRRGVPEDYDTWASRGNDEWAYKKVLPYFKKLEKDMDIHDDFHGGDGPIPVGRFKRETWLPAQEAFYQSCLGAGFPEHPDMNHPEATGVGPNPMTVPGGSRISTALTYLNPNRHRLNLTIRANVMARCILFDGNRATGVEVESGGERFTIEGDEIILSAGAIASPQLLMLSGVGPADHLRSLGIKETQDLPGVGQNLRDHPQVRVLVRVKEGFPQATDAPRQQTLLLYTAEDSSNRNDMEILPIVPPPGVDIRFTCVLGLAAGSGELRLTSTDPHVQPHLDYRYLVDAWDRQRLRESVHLTIRLIKHEAFRDIIADRTDPTDKDLDSDESLDAWMLQHVHTRQHISGTAKMGPSSDPLAVVNQYCQVHGVHGLRVADTSVMPDVVRANTNPTAIMIGERVADFIR